MWYAIVGISGFVLGNLTMLFGMFIYHGMKAVTGSHMGDSKPR
jgi:hypothetical protein